MIRTDEAIQKMLKSPNNFTKTRPKHVNFCPYCRAVVISIVLLPLAAILKRIPVKKRKDMTFEELRKNREKRLQIILGLIASYHFVNGFLYIILMDDDSILWGFVQIGFGIMFLFFPEVINIIKKTIPYLISFYNKPKSVLVRSKIRNVGTKIKPALVRLKILKVKIKIKPHISLPHSPPFIKSFFTEKHDKYCPPIFFVDTSKRKDLI